jgi:hypothetical protein
MHSGVACTTLRRIEELNSVEPEWRELWAADPYATPFQSLEWFVPRARHFGAFDLPTVLVYDRGSLAAILPFYRYLDLRGGERRLFLLGAGTGDYLDAVYGATCTPHHLRVALRSLSCDDDWDTLDLYQLRRESRLLRSVQQLALPGVRQLQSEACSRFPAGQFAAIDAATGDVLSQVRHALGKVGIHGGK